MTTKSETNWPKNVPFSHQGIANVLQLILDALREMAASHSNYPDAALVASKGSNAMRREEILDILTEAGDDIEDAIDHLDEWPIK